MGQNYIKIFFQLALLLSTSYGAKPPIPCSLEWVSLGSSFLLDSCVPVHQDELFIVKIIRDGKPIVGSFRRRTLESIVDVSDESGIQFLTNPYNCTVRFFLPELFEQRKAYMVSDGASENPAFIGRAFVNSEIFQNEWAVGTYTPSSSKLEIRVPENTTLTFNSFELLESTSPGLNMELTNFIFDSQLETGSKDVMGSEIIENKSSATINQTITHIKNITDIYRTTTTKKYVAQRTTTKTTKILWFKKETTTTETWTDSIEETVETRTTTVISVEKHVSVPPYQSIVACSEIEMREEEEIPYFATGRYSAQGLSASQVLSILEEDGIEGGKIVGDEVEIEVQGTFTYKLGLFTRFETSDINDPKGCMNRQL